MAADQQDTQPIHYINPAPPCPPPPPVPVAYAVTAPEHPQATTVFILGLLSVLGFPITGPVAWYLGSQAKKEIAAQPGRWTAGNLQAGWVLGIVGTAMLGLSLLLVVGYVVIALITLAIAAQGLR